MAFVIPSEETVKRCFTAFDRDNNGNISASEMQMVLSKCGFKVSQTHCTELIKVFDKNNSGVMKFQEFQQMVKVAVSMKVKEFEEDKDSS